MKLIHQVKCPDCGAHVDTEFTVVDTGTRTEHSCTISMTAIQSGPMVCDCGFEYVPTAEIMRQRLQEARERVGNIQGSTYGGGHISERHAGAESASIGELNDEGNQNG